MKVNWRMLLAALGLVAASETSVLAQEGGGAGPMEQGSRLYAQNCAICHGDDGRAVSPDFPSLAESESVEDLSLIVANVHQGVAIMPPFPWLSDEEIAAIASYVRNSWGNAYGQVKAEDVAAIRADLEPASEMRTIWESVYTAEQAKHGKAVYDGACALCHGRRLDGVPEDRDMLPGPPVGRAKFLRNWDGRSLGALYSYTRWTMPKSNPGFLSEEDYASLLAYMLEVSGVPAGDSPLPADPLETGLIRITPKQ